MEENTNQVRKKIPLFAHVAMRVPLLFAFNSLLNCVSLSWRQILDKVFVNKDDDLFVAEGNSFPILHLFLCLLGVICVFFLFILPPRIISKLYVLVISCGILQVSYWWNQQFLMKLHSNSSTEQWDMMFLERQPESWRHLESHQIIFSRDLLVYVILQCSYASLFAILLGQHIDMFLPRAVTFCNFVMFLPVMVAIIMHEPGVEIHLGQNLISTCQIVTIVVSLFVVTLWLWSVIFVSKTLKICEFFQMIRTIRRDFGLQVLIEHEWKRLRVPTLLRVFWISNSLWLASGHYINLWYKSNDIVAHLNWTTFTEIASEVAIAGCGSIIMLLGMSAVIAKIANQIGCVVHMIIKSTDEEEKYIGTVSAVLFFILALQTGLTELEGEARLVRLFRNSCLLFTAILHFIHNMLNQVMLTLGASQNMSVKRHMRVLFVDFLLLVIPFLLFYHLWMSYEMSTWILAVSAFCLELCIKVMVTTSVYTLYMIDACWNTYWENLDDYVYYLKGTGSVIEFLFGIFLFFNGGWILLFESGGIIRLIMMSIHAYFNIFVQAKDGWKMFQNRRTAVSKINSLEYATQTQLSGHDDVCAICHHELQTARVMPCGHLFHGVCLRKWLYVQDVCPLCQKKLVEKNKVEKNVVERVEDEPPEIAQALQNDPQEVAQALQNEPRQNSNRENEQGTGNITQDNTEQENSPVRTLDHRNDIEQFSDTDDENSLSGSNHVMMSVRHRRHCQTSRDIFVENVAQGSEAKVFENGQHGYLGNLGNISSSSSSDGFEE
ncbi:E3 ubiquitin-protein ligase RNF139-like [Anneissia japonica]|uniref:E3 ubiquitin-protein ligase RNF139-like n=1 Tax=Anneissia japonica TaxID=1529436 RepID=UPI0014257BBB|nr:E3 ubiquitin-protein ligase RNF139-like [Anneissia japonica]